MLSKRTANLLGRPKLVFWKLFIQNFWLKAEMNLQWIWLQWIGFLPIVVDTTHITCTSLEHQAISIKTNDKATTHICIYRPPQQRPLTVFFDELETLIIQIQGKTPNIVLAGRFNIPVNNPSSSSTEFIARLNDIGLENTVFGPAWKVTILPTKKWKSLRKSTGKGLW